MEHLLTAERTERLQRLVSRLQNTTRAKTIFGAAGATALCLVLRFLWRKRSGTSGKLITDLSEVGSQFGSNLNDEFDYIIIGGGMCTLISSLLSDVKTVTQAPPDVS